MDRARHGDATEPACVDDISDGSRLRRSGRLEASPEVVPLMILRKRDGIVVERLSERGWSDQQAGAKQKLRVEMIEAGGEKFGELEEYRTHDGQPGARGFVGERVEIGQEAVASFEVAAANGFLLGAIGPDFVRQRAFGGVIAT